MSLVLVIAALGATGYYYLYLTPRYHVEKSTRDLAPLANRTFDADNELADIH